MASTPSPSTLRSLYRRLLHELPKRPLSNRSPVHERIREAFSSRSPSSSSTTQETSSSSTSSSPSSLPLHNLSAHQVEEYIAYLKAQRVYTTLLERYNPGMNMDEEERVRLTLRRVGMQNPDDVVVKKG